jgi:hypothetical protein
MSCESSLADVYNMQLMLRYTVAPLALHVTVVENLQKYRYILENIDGVFRYFSWFVPNFAIHKLYRSIEKCFGCLVFFVSKICIFQLEYFATPWRVPVKYAHITWPTQTRAFSSLRSSLSESPGNEIGQAHQQHVDFAWNHYGPVELNIV